MLFLARPSVLRSQCQGVSTRRKRQTTTSDDPVYLNKTLIAEALNNTLQAINQQLNGSLLGVSPAPGVNSSAAAPAGVATTAIIIIVCVLGGIALAIIILTLAIRYITRTSFSKSSVSSERSSDDVPVFSPPPRRTYYISRQPAYHSSAYYIR
jgi:hypothetical protein